MSGPFYVLDRPWIDSRSQPTGILYGDCDPHVARHFADTSCLTGCQNCEGFGWEDDETHADDAEWLVEALNFAYHHPDGPGPPPFEVKRAERELKEKQAACNHRWEMMDPMDMDKCGKCDLERVNPNVRLDNLGYDKEGYGDS